MAKFLRYALMLIVVLTSSNSIMASKASTILIFGVVDEISREDLLSDVAFELRCNDSIIVPIDSVSLRNSTYILTQVSDLEFRPSPPVPEDALGTHCSRLSAVA
jgi:hypothetical protein